MNKWKNSSPGRASTSHRLPLARRWKEGGSANSRVWFRHAAARVYNEGKAQQNFKPSQEYDCCTQLELRRDAASGARVFGDHWSFQTPLAFFAFVNTYIHTHTRFCMRRGRTVICLYEWLLEGEVIRISTFSLPALVLFFVFVFLSSFPSYFVLSFHILLY